MQDGTRGSRREPKIKREEKEDEAEGSTTWVSMLCVFVGTTSEGVSCTFAYAAMIRESVNYSSRYSVRELSITLFSNPISFAVAD